MTTTYLNAVRRRNVVQDQRRVRDVVTPTCRHGCRQTATAAGPLDVFALTSPITRKPS